MSRMQQAAVNALSGGALSQVQNQVGHAVASAALDVTENALNQAGLAVPANMLHAARQALGNDRTLLGIGVGAAAGATIGGGIAAATALANDGAIDPTEKVAIAGASVAGAVVGGLIGSKL